MRFEDGRSRKLLEICKGSLKNKFSFEEAVYLETLVHISNEQVDVSTKHSHTLESNL